MTNQTGGIAIIDHANVFTDPNGYYLFARDGSGYVGILCDDCAATADLDDSVELEPAGANETDTPTHCDRCEALIVEALTDEGIEYVRQALEEADGRPEVLAAWLQAFGAYL